MKVFLTGGTGYLGTVLVEHLRAAGHEVAGLARSDAAAERLRVAGATPVAGSLADTDVLADAAATADAVVHAAVDYAMTEESAAVELGAVRALLAGAARGSGAAREIAPKPFVYTSTGLVYGFDEHQDTSEDAVLPEVSAQPVKAAAERLVRAEAGVIGIVVRAGMIFGRGGSGLVVGLIDSARRTGASVHVGDGLTTWLPVHVDDLADLYVAALERPVAGAYNAVGSVPFAFRDLAAAIGELTGTPVVSVPVEVAEQTMGPMARVLTTTSRLSATKAGATFGWTPAPRSLLEDVRSGSYAQAPAR